MPAHMAELLPEVPLTVFIDNAQRRHAALTLAQWFQDRHDLAFMLVELGLAVHGADGSLRSMPDREGASWHSPRTSAAFRVPVGSLDNCR
jgi:endonuclease YncB( thermonuclease family)